MLRKLFLGIGLALASGAIAQQATEIRMMAGSGFGIPPKEATTPTAQIRRAVFEEFHRQNPDVRVVNAGGLNLAGPQADNMFLMSMAGDRSPDVFYVNFRQYYTFLEQGFCRPLDDMIRREPEIMNRVNPTVNKVLRSYDGNVYAIPFFQVAVALYYRKDFFIEAGLDPNRPPQTWDELYEYALKLTNKEHFGFAFSNPAGYHWQNFVYQAGGEIVSPSETGRWMSRIATPEAAKAIEMYRRLVLPQGKNPAVGYNSPDLNNDANLGKVGMWFGYTNDVLMASSDISPSLLGVSALPAGPAGRSNEINAGMWAISSRVKDPKRLEACWRFIKFFSGDEAARINTVKCVELGLGNLVNPSWLKKFGYSDLLGTVDPSYVEANETLFKTGHPEPYGKNCQQVYTVLDEALDKARLDPGADALEILQQTSRTMNQKLLAYTPPEIQAMRRGWAVGILSLLLLTGSVFGGIGFARRRRNPVEIIERLPAGVSRAKIHRFLFVCIGPAALTILTWAYYPLFRGLVIAFQNYTIAKGATWVGLDNFLDVFTQPVFYKSLGNSFLYVALSLLIGFFLPIFLALGLNEIPRGQVFFRTVFYLPAMTSSVVVSLVWRQFYDKTETGLLNSLLKPVIENVANPVWTALGGAKIPIANDWLGNPTLAMFAVVLPGIWAGAGAGSILYLAALKNISAERYEAADIDGANWRQKIRYITLPGIKPST